MISNIDGSPLTESDHVEQALGDILTTPIGTRVMRRNYGSRLPNLISQPKTELTRLQIISETARAIEEWEPRIDVSKIAVDFDEENGFNVEISFVEKSTNQPKTTSVGVN